MTERQLLDALAQDSLQRLRWRVLSHFNIMPYSREARRIKNRHVILAAAHMVLDKTSASETNAAYVNSNFDQSRFLNLRRCSNEFK